MRLPLWQVDAFASKVFAGNPAAVVPLSEWLPDSMMLSIAAENNLAETAFIVPAGEGYAIRWFTPTVEMPLCGHATLASGWVVMSRLEPERASVTFQSKSGPLTVRRDGARLAMDFPSIPPGPETPNSDLVTALGAAPMALHEGFQWFAVYESAERVRSLRPDLAALGKLPLHGVVVTARGDDCDFVSRFFAPAAGVPEDPVTGAAHCRLIPYWARVLGKRKLHARQVSARGGELWCELDGDRVRMAGHTVLYLEGTIEV